MSLKSQIETTIAEAIDVIAGADSPDVDADLAAEEQLNSALGGALPFDQELTQGPLVRVMINSTYIDDEEFGNEDARVSTLLFDITVVGLSGTYADPAAASHGSSTLEEIIRLHLQNLEFNIETAYSSGRSSYAAILRYLGTEYDNVTLSGRQTAPVIGAATVLAGNSGNLDLQINPDEAFSGLVDVLYTVEIVSVNPNPHTVNGLSYRFKEDSGAFGAPLAVSNGYNPLSYGVSVLFSPFGTAQVGDSWTVAARSSELNFISTFTQQWALTAESVAVY